MPNSDDAGLAWEVLQRFTDPATANFDAVLAASGVNEETARALRFWQRESVAGVKQYAAHALPNVFRALAEGRADVIAAAERAEQAWTDAGRAVPRLPDLAIVPEEAGTEIQRKAALLEQRRRTVAARLAQIS